MVEQTEQLFANQVQKLTKPTIKQLRQFLQQRNKQLFAYLQDDQDFKQMAP